MNLTYEEKVVRGVEKLRDMNLTAFDLINFIYLHDLEYGVRSFPGTDMDVRHGNREAIIAAMKRKAKASKNEVWLAMVKDLQM